MDRDMDNKETWKANINIGARMGPNDIKLNGPFGPNPRFNPREGLNDKYMKITESYREFARKRAWEANHNIGARSGPNDIKLDGNGEWGFRRESVVERAESYLTEGVSIGSVVERSEKKMG